MITCPLHYLSGLECPFCGIQRGIAAIFSHGDFATAFALNPVVWTLSPALSLIAVALLTPQHRRGRLLSFAASDRAVFPTAAVLLLWGVVRNLL